MKKKTSNVNTIEEFNDTFRAFLDTLETFVRRGFKADHFNPERSGPVDKWYKESQAFTQSPTKFFMLDSDGNVLNALDQNSQTPASITFKQLVGKEANESKPPDYDIDHKYSYNKDVSDVMILLRCTNDQTASTVRNFIQAAISSGGEGAALGGHKSTKQTGPFVHISVNQILEVLTLQHYDSNAVQVKKHGTPTVRDIPDGEKLKSIQGAMKQLKFITTNLKEAQDCLRAAITSSTNFDQIRASGKARDTLALPPLPGLIQKGGGIIAVLGATPTIGALTGNSLMAPGSGPLAVGAGAMLYVVGRIARQAAEKFAGNMMGKDWARPTIDALETVAKLNLQETTKNPVKTIIGKLQLSFGAFIRKAVYNANVQPNDSMDRYDRGIRNRNFCSVAAALLPDGEKQEERTR